MLSTNRLRARVWATSLLAGVMATSGVILTDAAPVVAASTVTQTFNYTGSTQTFTVPSGVTSIMVTLKGGQGGRGGIDYPSYNAGGYQGVVTGTIEVTPGETITVAVGSGGGDGSGGGSAPGGTAGNNPLAGYDGAVGGRSGPAGSSGGGGGSGAATVIQVDGVDIVAGGAGGNGGNGQYAVLIGRVAEDHHVARPDATSTSGRPGYDTTIACGGTCDGGASGAGGGGAQGGDRGDVQYGGADATEWFGFGGAPGANATGGFVGLAASYAYYSGNNANGSVTFTYDDGAPSAPRNLAATAQTGAVALAWDAPTSEGASAITDYVVQYATNSGGPWTTFADGVSVTASAVVAPLTNGTAYFFRVAATNTQGTGSYATTAISTVPSDVPGRPVVTGLSVAGGTIHADITPPSSHAPITGYEYRLDGGAWIAGTVASNRLSITGLTNGRSYEVEIRALNVIGAGLPSTPAQSATPIDSPVAPTGLAGVGSDETIDVSWTAPTVDNGSAVTGYTVQTFALPSGPWTAATTVDDTELDATITGLVNGTTYRVRVAAENGAGLGAWSTTVDVTPYTTPGTPTVVLTPADGALSVAVGGDDGGSDLTLIEYRVDGGAWRSTGAGTTPFTIAGLTNGTEYEVEVRVTNAAGTSDPSAPVAGTPRAVPAAPSIAAMALDAGAVDVEFVLGAAGGSPVSNIEYSIDGGEHWTTRSPVSTLSPLQITGLVGGQSYDIVVRAVNAAGASAPSNTSTIRANGVPSAPTVSITPGDRTLLVAFTTPGNGGSPILGYEYSTDDGGSWTAVPSMESPFLLSGLTNGTPYEVHVRALNVAGPGAHGSATGTPRTTPSAPTLDGNTVADAGGQMAVLFTSPANDGGSPITNYEYSTDMGVTWRAFSPAATTSPLTITTLSTDGVTDLDGDATYPVEIRAVNAAGAGAASAVMASGVTTTVPDAPAIDTIERRDGAATVRFTPGANGGLAIIRYEYRLDGAVSWTDTGTLATTFEISPVAPGDHQLEVRAVNSAGDSAPSAIAPFSMFTLPGTPAIDLITAGDETLAVTFTAPADDGGSPITGYEYSTDGGITWRAAGTTTSPFDITLESGAGNVAIANGTLYSVQLRAVNAAGSGPATATTLVAPRGTPQAPTGLALTPLDGGLEVAFTLGADGGSPITAIEYQLGTGSWLPAGSLGSPLTITGLTNGTAYDVRVRLVNAIGTGAPSAPATGTPSALPSAPTAVDATSAPGGASVAWTAPASDGGAAISGYVVRAFSAATGGIPVATCAAASVAGCALTGLTNGTTSYVEVAATNATGTGPASAPRVAVVPLAAPRVSIGTITPAPTELTLAVVVDDFGGAPISDYEYQLDGGDWESTGSGASPFTIAGLESGTAYEIRIRATSSAGVGPASVPVDAVPHTVPGAPTTFAAASGPQSAVLTWQPPVSDGGQPVSDYLVQWATNVNGPFTTFADGTSSATTATVTGLTNTTAYVFRVAAVNTAGAGPWSSLAGATPRSAPGAPTINGITPGGSYLQVAFSAPADNGGAAVTGYQYRLDGGTWTNASGTTSPIAITGLTNGRQYAVQLRAVNSVGGGTASNSVNATPFGLPAGVVGFRAIPGANSVTLEWDAGDDGGSPITSYNLIRWNQAVAGSIIQSYPVTTTTATVTGLGAGTHWFTIEATNAAGTGPRSTPRTTAIIGNTVPSAPILGDVVVADGEVAMGWTAGAAGSSAIASYLVQYSSDGTTWTTASSGSSATSASFDLPSATTPYSVRVAAVSATGLGAWATAAMPLALTDEVTVVGDDDASVTGSVDANGLTVDVAIEYATSSALLGTAGSVIVPAVPATATGTDPTPVTASLTGLTPGTSYVARVVAHVGDVTAAGAAEPFATDALIATTDLTYTYTGSPVVIDTDTTPDALALSRTWVGINGTTYPSSATPPTVVGEYRVVTTPAVPAIGGSETVDILIEPKPVVVTIDAVDRDFDGTSLVALAFDVDGVVPGDTVDVDPAAATGELASPGAGTDLAVTIDVDDAALLTGDDAGNYTATWVAGDLTVTIAQAAQTLSITSMPPATPTAGTTYTVAATSTRGLTPSFDIAAGNGSVCTISGTTVSLVGAGTCTVRATQAGNADVLAATAVQQTFTVAPAPAPDAAIGLTLDLEVGAAAADAQVFVTASGLAPFSTVVVEMHSTPVVLGTFTTDANGDFSGMVTLPPKVDAGNHTIIVTGQTTGGDPIQESAKLFVDWSGSVGWSAGGGSAPTTPGAPPTPGASGPVASRYAAVTPVRVLDTRTGAGTKVAGGTAHRLAIDATSLPAGTTAVVVNLTVTEPEAAGFVTVYPCGSTRPWASSLNHRAGDTVANQVVASFRPGQELCLYTMSTTHLVVDLNGVYATDAGDPVVAQVPARLADTRTGTRVPAGGSLVVPVTGDGRAPQGASAVSLFVAAADPAAAGYLTVYPCDVAVPLASNVNFRAGQTIGNGVFAKVSATGTVCIHASADTDVVVDLTGAAVPGASSTFQPLVAGRLLDTRTTGALPAAGSTLVLDFSDVDGIGAVTLNLAAVDPTADGFLTLYPCGGERPFVASVNYMAGITHSNQVTVKIGDGGKVCLFTLRATDLVIDVEGVHLLPAG